MRLLIPNQKSTQLLSRSFFLVGISIGIVSFLTACGTTLDFDKIKTAIKDGIKTQMGITVESVTCPEKREVKAGDNFECTAKAEKDSTIIVSVKQDDDKGNIKWEVTGGKGVIDLTKIQTQIADSLKAQTGVGGTIDCGGKFKPVKVGEVFECSGKDDKGGSGTIEVTVKDMDGNVDWKLKK